MKILDGGKEHLDVEIDGKAYRLSGQLDANEFTAFADRTALLTQANEAMDMSERMELAAKSEPSSPKDFTDWLRNQDVQIVTNLQPLDEQEKKRVMQAVCDKWIDKTFSIYFYDGNSRLLCKSKNTEGERI
jgi:hypothetical protein